MLRTMTEVEIAASAGTMKEMVSRALAGLEAMRAIRRAGGHIVKLPSRQTHRRNRTRTIRPIRF